MKIFSTDKIRNISLAGQRGCGKTSLADAIAYTTGQNNRIGKVDDGSSLLDYTETEINRKTSISSKLLACDWQDTKINLLDCPGHSDFPGELLSALAVSDAVGILINAGAGVEIGTQLQWNSMAERRIARFFFVNKMELENVQWRSALESIQNAFGRAAVALQIPIGEGNGFQGLVDLLSMKAYTFDDTGKRNQTDIPDDLQDAARSEREKLIEVTAETDDTLTENS